MTIPKSLIVAAMLVSGATLAHKTVPRQVANRRLRVELRAIPLLYPLALDRVLTPSLVRNPLRGPTSPEKCTCQQGAPTVP
jgi:hypothetical protein